MIKNIITGFIIGSSLISCAVTYSYILFAYYKKNCPEDIAIIFDKFWVIPLGFGLINAGNIFLQSIFPTIPSMIIAFFAGAINGLIFSTIGHLLFHLPKRLFQFKKEFHVHFFSPFLYGIIYVLIVQPLNYYLIIS